MAVPPNSGPHSDLTGVNRDARAGQTTDDQHPNAGALKDKNESNAARPDETAPPE